MWSFQQEPEAQSNYLKTNQELTYNSQPANTSIYYIVQCFYFLAKLDIFGIFLITANVTNYAKKIGLIFTKMLISIFLILKTLLYTFFRHRTAKEHG
jgi:hypothetical protein